MKKFIVLLLLFNIAPNNASVNFAECEESIAKKQYEIIASKCSDIKEDSIKAKSYKSIAQLLEKVSYQRIDEIFAYGEANMDVSHYLNNKKMFSNIEKYYLQNAYKELQKYPNIKSDLVNLLYAKIAYINVMYIQLFHTGIISSDTFKIERDFKSKVYIPKLKSYIAQNPEDKEVLYLLGMQALELSFPPNPNPMYLYYKVVDGELFNYLEKSAKLNFQRAKLALIAVSNWEKYVNKLVKDANSNDKDALYKLGMQNFNAYIDGKNQKKDLLEKAINYFNKAQLLGHESALWSLARIYYGYKPNKEKFTELLEKSVNKYGHGHLSLGNLYWCNGDKKRAKEMYVKAKNKGDINSSEAILALEDLTKLKEPYDGCKFK